MSFGKRGRSDDDGDARYGGDASGGSYFGGSSNGGFGCFGGSPGGTGFSKASSSELGSRRIVKGSSSGNSSGSEPSTRKDLYNSHLLQLNTRFKQHVESFLSNPDGQVMHRASDP